MTATANRADWLGRIIDGRFRLLDNLGGSNHARVFRTEISDPSPRNAAIKLIPASEAGSVDLLAQWQVAQTLQHPHLASILAFGRCRVDISHYFYVVTEFADELLSQIIPDRPLTAEETHDMLAPVLDTLAYLHGNGFVHGHLIPSNILVIGEQLKISADDIVAAGAPRSPRPVELHDAPEVETTPASQAQDIWSLGATLVESLTQQAPAWDRSSDAAPEVPSTLPAPYKAIALRCLQLDPARRPTVENVQALLEGRAAPPPEPQRAAAPAPQPRRAAQQPPPAPVPAPAVAQGNPAGPITSPKETHSYLHRLETADPKSSQPDTFKPATSEPDLPGLEKSRRPVMPFIVGFVVVLAIIVAFAVHHTSTPAPTQQQTQPAPSASATTPENPPANPATSSPAPTSDTPGPAAPAQSETTPPPTTQPVPQQTASTSAPAPAPPAAIHVSQGPAEQGAVLDRVLPDIPAKAMNTITGTVKIAVKVTVDSSGSVTDASLASAGPSPYFANYALKASRAWKFRPAQSNGQPTTSTWLLHYRLRHSGIEVTPEEQKP